MGRGSEPGRTVRLLVMLAFLCLPGIAAAQVTLELVPSAPAVPPGGSVDVEVRVSGLGAGAAPSLGTFDVDVLFDDAFFGFTGLTFGTDLGDPGAGEAITGGPAVAGGTLANVLEVSLLMPATLNGRRRGSRSMRF